MNRPLFVNVNGMLVNLQGCRDISIRDLSICFHFGPKEDDLCFGFHSLEAASKELAEITAKLTQAGLFLL